MLLSILPRQTEGGGIQKLVDLCPVQSRTPPSFLSNMIEIEMYVFCPVFGLHDYICIVKGGAHMCFIDT